MPKTGLLETPDDKLNFNTKAIIQRAAQPFEGMHLLGAAKKLEAKGEAAKAKVVEAQYNQKFSLARFGFLEGLVKFYFQQCQTINVDQRLDQHLDQHSQLVLAKCKENLTTVYHELNDFSASAPQATAALQGQIKDALRFIHKVEPYREYQESSFFSATGFLGMFSSPERPTLVAQTSQSRLEFKYSVL